MGNLRLVDFLIRARFDLPADVGDGRRGQVVAGFAGQDFCLQCFVAVVIIGTRLDAGFFFKGGDGFGIDIIRPVVDIEFARLSGFGLGGGGGGRRYRFRRRTQSRRGSGSPPPPVFFSWFSTFRSKIKNIAGTDGPPASEAVGAAGRLSWPLVQQGLH